MRTGIGLSLIALLAASAPTAESDPKPPAVRPGSLQAIQAGGEVTTGGRTRHVE